MPYPNEIMIGHYYDGVDGMTAISALGRGDYADNIQEGAFTVDPVSYSQVQQRADGSLVERGWLQSAWHINFLRDSQWEALNEYKVGSSTPLYIRTLKNDGKTYGNYLGRALWPVQTIRADPTAVEDGTVFDYEIKFINLVEIPEA